MGVMAELDLPGYLLHRLFSDLPVRSPVESNPKMPLRANELGWFASCQLSCHGRARLHNSISTWLHTYITLLAACSRPVASFSSSHVGTLLPIILFRTYLRSGSLSIIIASHRIMEH
uniref:Uncharacterized protein n=1 Tax=Bionectria ochroleuca TaxID=29856 RepID=A0A8H7TJK1_BIOOC